MPASQAEASTAQSSQASAVIAAVPQYATVVLQAEPLPLSVDASVPVDTGQSSQTDC